MKREFGSGRYANVTATLALVVALSGTSYAAITLPKNSVGSKQIKANAVSSGKVKDGSLLTKDFKAGQLPAGAKGDTGPAGPKGDTGTVDTAAFYPKTQSDARFLRRTITVTKTGTAEMGSFDAVRVACPAGHEALGGGIDLDDVFRMQVTSSGPIIDTTRSIFATDGEHPAATGWQASAVNNSGGQARFVVSVVCSPIG